jgi:hypothetical protein
MTETMRVIRVVETEPQSPFDGLWRLFPKLKNATCVGRMSWASRDGDYGVLRTFRTLDAKYIRIRSTEEGNKLEPVPADEIEIYESVWKQLGSRRALGEPTNEPHGIMFASDEFFELTEDQFERELIRAALFEKDDDYDG